MLGTSPMTHTVDIAKPEHRAHATSLLRTSGDIGMLSGALVRVREGRLRLRLRLHRHRRPHLRSRPPLFPPISSRSVLPVVEALGHGGGRFFYGHGDAFEWRYVTGGLTVVRLSQLEPYPRAHGAAEVTPIMRVALIRDREGACATVPSSSA